MGELSAHVLSKATEVAQGRALILAMGFEEHFNAQFAAHVDSFNRFHFTSCSLENWGILTTNSISFVASTATCMLVLMGGHADPVLAGLAVTYSFLLPYFLGMLYLLIAMFLKAATSSQ